MIRQKYDYVFIVLTYRNTKDLCDFIINVNMTINESYKIIVVNSFYDEFSLNEFHIIAHSNDCDFINVENKGYGYGNNRGVEYAKSKYYFKFLVVSNPDIEIKRMPIDELNNYENSIIAPTIKTLNGKNQNPYYHTKIEMVELLKYYSCKKRIKTLAYIGIAINKIHRELMLFVDRVLKVKVRKIYACHGSFIIIGSEALDKLGELFDERMFLFSEENHLARLASEKSIHIFMIPKLEVLHKEDGSVSLESEIMPEHARKSFIVYYENWNNKSKEL